LLGVELINQNKQFTADILLAMSQSNAYVSARLVGCWSVAIGELVVLKIFK
jgi:hypothetical protein